MSMKANVPSRRCTLGVQAGSRAVGAVRRRQYIEVPLGCLSIYDVLAYVTKDQAETSVLFELISARYEQRSLLITANQPFGEWGKIFPDPATTLAAVTLSDNQPEEDVCQRDTTE